MVLAHGSGVDELLMFGIPVVAAIIALRVAEKRARQRIEDERADIDSTGPAGS